MSSRTDRIAEWLLRTNAHLPLPVLHSIGNILGSLLAFIPGRRLATCRTNIVRCFPELSNSQKNRLVRQNLRQTAKAVMEVGRLWLRPAEANLALIKAVSGEEHVRHVLAQGKGVILATPHLGSWELFGSYCSAQYPLTSMFQEPPLKGLDQLIKNGREGSGGRYVATDNSGIRALLQALRKGEMIRSQRKEASLHHFLETLH